MEHRIAGEVVTMPYRHTDGIAIRESDGNHFAGSAVLSPYLGKRVVLTIRTEDDGGPSASSTDKLLKEQAGIIEKLRNELSAAHQCRRETEHSLATVTKAYDRKSKAIRMLLRTLRLLAHEEQP